MRGRVRLAALALSLLGADASAQTTPRVAIPSFAEPRSRAELERPRDLTMLRFLTSDDHPPFSYVASDGALAGFSIDVARAVCETVDLACSVQVLPWETLTDRLDDAPNQVLLAALAITPQSRETLDFTRPYLTTPARFVARQNPELTEIRPAALAGRRVAVAAGSPHEAYLKAFFPDVALMSLPSAEEAPLAVKEGRADFAFGDGVALGLWLAGPQAEDCCRFVGGPYTEPNFFGRGVAMAVPRGEARLRALLDAALDRLEATGRFEEIYLRHFPLSIY